MRLGQGQVWRFLADHSGEHRRTDRTESRKDDARHAQDEKNHHCGSSKGRKSEVNQKDIATTFLHMASSGRVREAYEQFIHPGFRHHNAYFKGDGESLLKAMEENASQFPDKTYQTLRMLEEE